MTYLNINKDVSIKYEDTKTFQIKKGYYNIENLQIIFKKVGCELEFDKKTGYVKITGSDKEDVEVPDEIIYPLGLSDDIKTGSKTLPPKVSIENFILPKLTPLSLYVYLEQLDRDANLLNGDPSNLLCIIPLKSSPRFGDIISIEPASSFEKLAGLNINRFKFSIKDGMEMKLWIQM